MGLGFARTAGRPGRHLERVLADQQDRLFLWVPVLFGGGIGLYFNLAAEPSLMVLAPIFAAAVLAWFFCRHSLAGIMVAGAALWLAAGLVAAKMLALFVASPVLEGPMRRAVVSGWVELVEPRVGGDQRLTIRLTTMEPVPAGGMPVRVRIRVRGTDETLQPGSGVTVAASLLPPSGPALPGAYDFGRTAWFQALGAVGYARQPATLVVIDEELPWTLRLWVPIERLRQIIERRIRAALPGETGAIAAAMVTGERGGITDKTNAAYRDSGIFHILSISGLHMTVFAGALYFSIRLLLSLIPYLALRWPIKKLAALGGIAGTAAYLLISGGSPPAVRSALMIGIMFIAVLMDRPALALRNVALAALLILIATPQSLIDVGFQMSFAAVVALITGIEALTEWQRSRAAHSRRPGGGSVLALLAFLGGIVSTTVIATLAVAPLAAYYFHKSTQYGVVANLVAIPICNLFVMPTALATLVAMPFGLEAWPLVVMGWAVDAMTLVAVRVAAIPGAVAVLPEISTSAFSLMVCGGIWLCLWQGRGRLLGLAPILVGVALAPLRQPPDILVSANAQLVAVRGRDGHYAALDAARSQFELGRWLEHDGDARLPADVGPGRLFVCDPAGCVTEARGRTVAIARHPSALRDDCRLAEVVIWVGHGPASCPGTTTIIDRPELARSGTHAIVLGAGPATPPVIETVAARRGNRPWSARQGVR